MALASPSLPGAVGEPCDKAIAPTLATAARQRQPARSGAGCHRWGTPALSVACALVVAVGWQLQFPHRRLTVFEFTDQNLAGQSHKQPVVENAGNVIDGLF